MQHSYPTASTDQSPQPPAIGILGGMGPLATLDFVQKLLQLTPATRDQEHLPLLIHSVPQIPDRTASLMKGAESPLPALQQGLSTLVSAGARCVVIPCNTAHFWYPALKEASAVDMLHIAELVAEKLSEESVERVALLATDGTLKAGFYPDFLGKKSIRCDLPDNNQQKQVMKGIYLVKGSQITDGAALLESVAAQMLNLGAEKVILGCTEIPLALDSLQSPLRPKTLDATHCLAQGCISWYQRALVC